MLNDNVMSPECVFYDYQKKMENQLCQVCQNLAVGFHYGAYVCEACKKFFKRYMFSHSADNVGCKEECDIDRFGRRKCADCRYKKCIRIGMRLSISLTDKHEFDISKIPCRICGSKSSGFHFGSLTCEGCKGFFRRADTIKDRLTCSSKGDCYINFSNRSMCKYCRYQQCLKAGMSKAGSRIGRQPNAVKHHCVLEIANYEARKSETSENTYAISESSLADNYSTEETMKAQIKAEYLTTDSNVSLVVPNHDLSDIESVHAKITDALSVLQMPFCEALTLLQMTRNYLHRDQTLMEVWSAMMQHFDVHSHMLIQFAKKIPIFNDLSLVDKRILVQESMYPIILLNLARSYVEHEERFNYFDFTEQEYQVILAHFPSVHTIMSHVMNISRVVHNMSFCDKQIGLFCVMEIFKNYHHLESQGSVKVFYDYAVRLCWLSIIDQILESESAVNAKDVDVIDISSSLLKLHCPPDLVDHIAHKLSSSNSRELSLQKLRVVFVYFGEWLQKYNIEHQTIIDQLKVINPGLPYSELYVEMFQLSAGSSVQ